MRWRVNFNFQCLSSDPLCNLICSDAKCKPKILLDVGLQGQMTTGSINLCQLRTQTLKIVFARYAHGMQSINGRLPNK